LVTKSHHAAKWNYWNYKPHKKKASKQNLDAFFVETNQKKSHVLQHDFPPNEKKTTRVMNEKHPKLCLIE